MIDIHSHILPGIDDGPQSMEETIAMLEHAVNNEGITKIIATPHLNSRYNNTTDIITQKVEELNRIIKQENIPIEVLPGMEPRIYGEILEDYESGNITTLNHTKHLFIELPSNHVPRYSERLLFDIQLAGLQPIIVHPERNQEIMEDPNILYSFVKQGACSQVTAASITGKFGKKIQKLSMQLIEANLVHFIASDAHNLQGRSFHLREAYDLIEKEYGTSALYMFNDNAELVVEGKSIYKDVPEKIKKRKFLGIF